MKIDLKPKRKDVIRSPTGLMRDPHLPVNWPERGSNTHHMEKALTATTVNAARNMWRIGNQAMNHKRNTRNAVLSTRKENNQNRTKAKVH